MKHAALGITFDRLYLAQSLKGLDIAGVKRQKLFLVTCDCIEDICIVEEREEEWLGLC